MALIEQNALLRDRETYVKFSTVMRVWRWLSNHVKMRKHPHIRDISPRMARDAGLSAADLAQHQLRLPSQHTHHPRG